MFQYVHNICDEGIYDNDDQVENVSGVFEAALYEFVITITKVFVLKYNDWFLFQLKLSAFQKSAALIQICQEKEVRRD